MTHNSHNINRIYYPYQSEDAIFNADNDYFTQGSETTWSTFTDVLSASSEERNTSTQSFVSKESENYFPLAKLLEESWWNVFDEKYLIHSWPWTLTIIMAYMTILFAGVIGNCMVILVVLQRHKMRTVTNMFIMNLAVADLSVIVFCVGPTLLANVLQPWILGSFMCKGVAYVQGVSVCASAFSLVAISLDRCYAVYRPLDRYRGISKSQAFKTISIIWLIALILTIPWAVVFEIVISDKIGLSYCNEVWENEFYGKMYFLFVHLIFCYGLPLVIISVSNAVVWCHVNNRKVPQESESAAMIVKRVHRRVRENARKMLGIVTFTFLISWLPLYIIVTRVKFATDMSDSELNFIHTIMPFAQWLGSWNSCINPILYAFLNRKFREEFHSLLPSWVSFFNVNKILGIGIGGYGVNVSTRNFSSTLRQSRSRSCPNSARIHNRGHRNRTNMLVSIYRNDNRAISTIRVPVNSTVVDLQGGNNSITLSTANNVVRKGRSGSITDL